MALDFSSINNQLKDSFVSEKMANQKKLVGTLLSTKMYQESISTPEISPAGHSQIVNPNIILIIHGPYHNVWCICLHLP